MRERLEEFARPGDAVVLMGDFNVDRVSLRDAFGEVGYKPEGFAWGRGLELRDCYASYRATSKSGTTVNSSRPGGEWLDHVFSNLEVTGRSDVELEGGKMPDGVEGSDHLPVFVEFEV